MANKCYICGFSGNPDNAHYCGQCGELIDFIELNMYYHWAPKNSQAWIRFENEYVLIRRKELSAYQSDRNELRQYKESFGYKLQQQWSKFKGYVSGISTTWLK